MKIKMFECVDYLWKKIQQMKNKSEQAVDTFRSGYNCAQSVLSVFADDLGLSRDAGLRLAGPFGGGMAGRQETCGAVTGALMAIGLKFGKGEAGSDADKERAYDLSHEFMTGFARRHHSLRCRDLLDNLDMHSPEGKAEIEQRRLFENRCPQLIRDAVEITGRILGIPTQ